ncbi:hypothetical protein Zmor_017172 [Zophobas morio]|uniref:Protein hunchback n=1 Tax=Zophobas morio TaxID=2755281 RepID=A0AA38MC67_9CUCU|nr:hypothetical protein Zmor_017172 [Zophobas morio]
MLPLQHSDFSRTRAPSKNVHRLSLFDCTNSNLEAYTCRECTFQTRLIFLFQQHLKCHDIKQDSQNGPPKGENALNNYVCQVCNFDTYFSLKWLQHVTQCPKNTETNCRKHKIFKHLSDNDSIWYHCVKCPYKVKRRSDLKGLCVDRRFMRWYKCGMCPYKTKRLGNLKMHINARHLNEGDIKWYKCGKCPYKAKDNSTLKRHIKVRHLGEEDVKWYKCDKCPYKSKLSTPLKQHINALHLDEGDVQWYECQQCVFKSKRKSSLNRHINKRH